MSFKTVPRLICLSNFIKMQAERRLDKTLLAASAPIAVSRIIYQYSVISKAMIRKTKMSIKCGFQFTLAVRSLPGLPF